MNDLPRYRKGGSKLKTTRVILEAYLKILEEKRPCCIHTAKMSLWDTQLTEEYKRTEISRMMDNMAQRLDVAFYVHYPTKPPEGFQLAHLRGLTTLDEYITTVKQALELPKEYCCDLPIHG